MSRKKSSTRTPQKPKIRNFVAKHAVVVARGAGAHKDTKNDYQRKPRNADRAWSLEMSASEND